MLKGLLLILRVEGQAAGVMVGLTWLGLMASVERGREAVERGCKRLLLV
jgi:hypothetical protein